MSWTRGQAAEVDRAKKAGFPLETSCPTGKRTFSSRNRAKRQLKKLQKRRATEGRKFMEQDIYPCRHCHGWHTTSQTQ